MLGIAIDVVLAAALLAVWYICFLYYNRRRAGQVLHCVEAACHGQGHIHHVHWAGAAGLQAQLALSVGWIENARVSLKLRPRPVPIQWLLSIFRKQKETLTFEADLDCVPGFHLEVYRNRWLTHHRPAKELTSGNWHIARPGAVVLTTRATFPQEVTPIVNTLMTSRKHELVSVCFRPHSPHLAATVALDAVSGEQAAASFLEIVHDLVTGASTASQ